MEKDGGVAWNMIPTDESCHHITMILRNCGLLASVVLGGNWGEDKWSFKKLTSSWETALPFPAAEQCYYTWNRIEYISTRRFSVSTHKSFAGLFVVRQP